MFEYPVHLWVLYFEDGLFFVMLYLHLIFSYPQKALSYLALQIKHAQESRTKELLNRLQMELTANASTAALASDRIRLPPNLRLNSLEGFKYSILFIF